MTDDLLYEMLIETAARPTEAAQIVVDRLHAALGATSVAVVGQTYEYRSGSRNVIFAKSTEIPHALFHDYIHGEAIPAKNRRTDAGYILVIGKHQRY